MRLAAKVTLVTGTGSASGCSDERLATEGAAIAAVEVHRATGATGDEATAVGGT